MPYVWIFEFIRASRSKVMVKNGSIECSAEAAQLDASHISKKVSKMCYFAPAAFGSGLVALLAYRNGSLIRTGVGLEFSGVVLVCGTN